MLLEKLSGLHSTYIDYHMYLTNLFAIPAIVMMVMALKDKKKNFYNGLMSYKQGLIPGIILLWEPHARTGSRVSRIKWKMLYDEI